MYEHVATEFILPKYSWLAFHSTAWKMKRVSRPFFPHRTYENIQLLWKVGQRVFWERVWGTKALRPNSKLERSDLEACLWHTTVSLAWQYFPVKTSAFKTSSFDWLLFLYWMTLVRLGSLLVPYNCIGLKNFFRQNVKVQIIFIGLTIFSVSDDVGQAGV